LTLIQLFLLFFVSHKEIHKTWKLTNKSYKMSTLKNALEHSDTDARGTISQKSRLSTLNILVLLLPNKMP